MAARRASASGEMAGVAVRRTPSRYGPGGSAARNAALARNKSVRKSFKEVNAFRYSSFIDLLYFSSRKYVLRESLAPAVFTSLVTPGPPLSRPCRTALLAASSCSLSPTLILCPPATLCPSKLLVAQPVFSSSSRFLTHDYLCCWLHLIHPNSPLILFSSPKPIVFHPEVPCYPT